jgi:hypothetical protein
VKSFITDVELRVIVTPGLVTTLLYSKFVISSECLHFVVNHVYLNLKLTAILDLSSPQDFVFQYFGKSSLLPDLVISRV